MEQDEFSTEVFIYPPPAHLHAIFNPHLESPVISYRSAPKCVHICLYFYVVIRYSFHFNEPLIIKSTGNFRNLTEKQQHSRKTRCPRPVCNVFLLMKGK